MRKSYILIVLALILSACASQQTTATEAVVEDTATEESSDATTSETVMPTVVPTNEFEASSGPAICTVSKMELPTAIPDENLPYPPHSRG